MDGNVAENLRGYILIDLTRLNGTSFTLNSDLIESVEETPDTVICLTNGRKFIVKESRQDIKNLVLSYKRHVYAQLTDFNE